MRTETPFGKAMQEEGRRQDWLARLLGVKPEQVSRWVNGVHEPTDATKRSIAAALHRPVESIWPSLAVDGTTAPLSDDVDRKAAA